MAENNSPDGSSLSDWFAERVQRGVEKVVEDFVAKAIYATLALATLSAVTLATLLWHGLRLSTTWKVVGVVAAAVLFLSLAAALVGVVRLARRTRRLQLWQVSELEDQLAQVAYGVEFVLDILARLQQMLAADEIFNYDELAEGGVLEPTQEFLRRAPGEQLRLSVLAPKGNVFRMRWAIGHRPMSKRRFEISINDSFAGRAFHLRETLYSPNVAEDERFNAHPKATRPYSSLVSTPIRFGEDPVAVLNVISTYTEIFTEADIMFIELVAAVLSLLWAVEEDENWHNQQAEGTPSEL